MKKIRYQLTLAMIASTIIVFGLVIFSINYYQQNYILNRAESALQSEARYYRSEQMPLEDDYDSRFFDVDVAFIDADFNAVKFDENNYFTREDYFFNRLYYQSELPKDAIVEVSSDFADYYAILLEAPDAILFGEPYDDDSWPSSVDTMPTSSLLVLFVDISASTNLINNLNVVFMVALLLAVVVEGLIGIYLGKRLEDSQLKLKHFFQNASHELKTPLMSIQGYAEGAKSGVIAEKAMAFDVILKQSDKMRRLIDEMLNISKLDSRGYQLKREAVDMLDIVEACIEDYQVLAARAGINLNLQCDGSDYDLIGDGLQLYKAVGTIVGNAVKYAATTVQLTLQKKGKQISVEIYNDGSPIGDDDVKHIFDRFYSGEHASSGIGLAMAKQIVALSKGRIAVENKMAGVAFKIELPTK